MPSPLLPPSHRPFPAPLQFPAPLVLATGFLSFAPLPFADFLLRITPPALGGLWGPLRKELVSRTPIRHAAAATAGGVSGAGALPVSASAAVASAVAAAESAGELPLEDASRMLLPMSRDLGTARTTDTAGEEDSHASAVGPSSARRRRRGSSAGTH